MDSLPGLRAQGWLASVGFLAAFTCSPAATAQDALEWKPGTQFTYVDRDLWGKESARWEDTVKSAGPQGFEVERLFGGTTFKFTVSPQNVITRKLPREDGTFSYSPVQLPIKEGAEWKWTFEYVTRSKGDRAQHIRNCRMGGLEEVKVPAGTYSARKIECRGTYQAGSFRGSSQTTTWWAPAITATVKIIDVDNYPGGRDVTTTTLDAVKTE